MKGQPNQDSNVAPPSQWRNHATNRADEAGFKNYDSMNCKGNHTVQALSELAQKWKIPTPQYEPMEKEGDMATTSHYRQSNAPEAPILLCSSHIRVVEKK